MDQSPKLVGNLRNSTFSTRWLIDRLKGQKNKEIYFVVRIVLESKGRILFGEPLNAFGEVVTIFGVFRRNRHGNNRVSDVNRLHRYFQLWVVGERVTGRAIHSKKRENVAGIDFVHVLHCVRMQTHQSRNSNFPLCSRVENRIAFHYFSLVTTEIRQLTELSGFQFEGQTDERFLIVSRWIQQNFFCFSPETILKRWLFPAKNMDKRKLFEKCGLCEFFRFIHVGIFRS